MRSWHAQAATAIKKDLQKRYPLVQFAVKSDMYSVTARWTDGPTAHDVEQVMNPYTNGSFDGMTDSYNYTKSEKPFSVNYVFAERDYSDKARDDMRAKLTVKYDLKATGDEDALASRWNGLWTVGQLINHELRTVTLGPREADEISEEDLEAAAAFMDKHSHASEQD
jgi:hypothetical protein